MIEETSRDWNKKKYDYGELIGILDECLYTIAEYDSDEEEVLEKEQYIDNTIETLIEMNVDQETASYILMGIYCRIDLPEKKKKKRYEQYYYELCSALRRLPRIKLNK